MADAPRTESLDEKEMSSEERLNYLVERVSMSTYFLYKKVKI
jgi:hypothetical protein